MDLQTENRGDQSGMIEFNYKLDYKNILFKPNDKRYRIGREQGVLLVRPYTNDIVNTGDLKLWMSKRKCLYYF